MVRRPFGLLLLLAALLSLAGCGELQPLDQKHYLVYHTVRQGDTLYSVAWRYGYDYREVAAWNHIGPPYQIFPGQRLLIIPSGQGAPADATPVASAPPTVTATPSAKVEPPPATRPKKSGLTIEKPVTRPNQNGVRWRWPVPGEVKRAFADSGSKKGIDIGGRVGQPVYAAASGQVVYSGNGLVGYGNLVIIKHDDVYLSAYGNNSRLLVKEGQQVTSGQMIAEMGQTGKDGAILHFEIRQDGKPIDPLQLLPRKNL